VNVGFRTIISSVFCHAILHSEECFGISTIHLCYCGCCELHRHYQCTCTCVCGGMVRTQEHRLRCSPTSPSSEPQSPFSAFFHFPLCCVSATFHPHQLSFHFPHLTPQHNWRAALLSNRTPSTWSCLST
jgi:hypothetical protein